MTDDPIPLYIWSTTKPTPEQMEILRQAKHSSGVTEKCKPVRAVAGCGRAISFEGRPPFYCEWVEPWDFDDPDLPAMVKWVLTGEGFTPYSGLMWMQAVIGPEVKEVA